FRKRAEVFRACNDAQMRRSGGPQNDPHPFDLVLREVVAHSLHQVRRTSDADVLPSPRQEGVVPGCGDLVVVWVDECHGDRFAEQTRHGLLVSQLCHSGSPSRASTKASGSNGARSSGPSPRPTSFTGTPSSRCTEMTMPPFAVPSSLVSTMPLTSTTSPNTRACTRPF